MAKVFFSYSHDDEALRDQLEKHLASLKHEGAIESWHDRRILAGEHLDASIDAQIDTADIVLLLVSSSFLSSHYCYSIEMNRALERMANGECRVVPVILRDCDWQHTPLGKLLALPRDGKPITSWTNHDEAYTDVVRRLRSLVQELTQSPQAATTRPSGLAHALAQMSASEAASTLDAPRSSNLRLRKTFTDLDKDEFAHSTFDHIRRLFSNSLAELEARNPGIKTGFRNITDGRFSASIYRDGSAVSECEIALASDFGRHGITYSSQIGSGGYNEILTPENDDQEIFYKPLMGQHTHSISKLSQEGAAEFLWSNLIERLQR